MHIVVQTVQHYTKENGGTGAVIMLISMSHKVLNPLCGTMAAAGSTTPVWR